MKALADLSPQSVCVLGTDTDVGKTYVCVALAQAWLKAGTDVGIYKPVECALPGEKDSDVYRAALGDDRRCAVSYSFDRPVSPHFEAARTGQAIEQCKIIENYQSVCKKFSTVIVEGAGGVLCPLGQGLNFADIVSPLDLPVWLVVKNRVGCINHTLLSVEALRSRGTTVAGLIVNGALPAENISALASLCAVEVLSVLDWN